MTTYVFVPMDDPPLYERMSVQGMYMCTRCGKFIRRGLRNFAAHPQACRPPKWREKMVGTIPKWLINGRQLMMFQ